MIQPAIDHVVIVVSEIEAGIRTWRDQLGFQLSHQVELDDVGISQAFFILDGGSFIELVAPTRNDSPLAEALAKNGEGFRLLSIRVEDLDATVAQLASNGVKLRGVGTPRVFIEPESASGILIQLWPQDRPHRWRERLGK